MTCDVPQGSVWRYTVQYTEYYEHLPLLTNSARGNYTVYQDQEEGDLRISSSHLTCLLPGDVWCLTTTAENRFRFFQTGTQLAEVRRGRTCEVWSDNILFVSDRELLLSLAAAAPLHSRVQHSENKSHQQSPADGLLVLKQTNVAFYLCLCFVLLAFCQRLKILILRSIGLPYFDFLVKRMKARHLPLLLKIGAAMPSTQLC